MGELLQLCVYSYNMYLCITYIVYNQFSYGYTSFQVNSMYENQIFQKSKLRGCPICGTRGDGNSWRSFLDASYMCYSNRVTHVSLHSLYLEFLCSVEHVSWLVSQV